MIFRALLAAIASLCLLLFVAPVSAASIDARFPHLERQARAPAARHARAHVRRHHAKRPHRQARRHHHARRYASRPYSGKPYGRRLRHERLFVRPLAVQLAGLPRFVFGRLVCAVNVNRALAARGERGTGSALAKSFLRWGRPSGPVPGAIAIYNRGRSKRSGHVAIVSRVVDGKVYVWNPGRHGWREIVYRRPAIAYRVS